MANKLIQLTSGSDNLYIKPYYKAYSMTRIENSYVTQTAADRIVARRSGHFGMIYLNLQAGQIPANTATFSIGKFDFSLVRDELLIVPPQNGANVSIMVTIKSDGTVQIANYSANNTADTWFRAMIPVMFTDDSN